MRFAGRLGLAAILALATLIIVGLGVEFHRDVQGREARLSAALEAAPDGEARRALIDGEAATRLGRFWPPYARAIRVAEMRALVQRVAHTIDELKKRHAAAEESWALRPPTLTDAPTPTAAPTR